MKAAKHDYMMKEKKAAFALKAHKKAKAAE